MNLNALKTLAVAIGASAMLAACGGGGSGSTSTGGVYYTHDQLAAEFVNRAYGDAGIDATLVKSNTLQYNYIVVYDYDYDTYDAYYIGGWSVGMNVNTWISSHNSLNYYDLDVIGTNTYQDWYTGITFEQGQAGSKDLTKLSAFKQELAIQKSAAKIQQNFGLSEDRSKQVAKLAVQLANTPKSSMTDADYDNFSKELLGSSITQFKTAMKKSAEGDAKDLSNLMDKAAQVNGVGPEHMQQIMNGLMQGK